MIKLVDCIANTNYIIQFKLMQSLIPRLHSGNKLVWSWSFQLNMNFKTVECQKTEKEL